MRRQHIIAVLSIAYDLSIGANLGTRYDFLGDCLQTLSRVSDARVAYFKAYQELVASNDAPWTAAVLREQLHAPLLRMAC